MTAKEINQAALENLKKQDWQSAQKLFFENARKNPSHKTYNNLGVFLITEGLTCRNGTSRNATKLGLKAAETEDTEINLCALVMALDYELRTAKTSDKDRVCRQSFEYLTKSLEIEYSYENQYNLLRLLCLINQSEFDILERVRNFVKKFPFKESACLYLELLRINEYREEGLRCIEDYKEYLDDLDLLMFYARVGLFQEGYALCDIVLREFAADKFIASAIIECCVNTNHLFEARRYAKKIEDMEESVIYCGKEKWCKHVFSSLNTSTEYRKEKIIDYSSVPPMIDRCCYFGCPIHNVDW